MSFLKSFCHTFPRELSVASGRCSTIMPRTAEGSNLCPCPEKAVTQHTHSQQALSHSAVILWTLTFTMETPEPMLTRR